MIVHRPGLELSRPIPQNIGGLLFDDVIYLGQLLAETAPLRALLDDLDNDAREIWSI